jgi:PAS domain S-box-containing protein
VIVIVPARRLDLCHPGRYLGAVTDALPTVDADALRRRLAAAEDAAVVRALHLALAHKRGVAVPTLAERYDYAPGTVRDVFRALEAGRYDDLPSVLDADAADRTTAGGPTGVASIVDAAPLALVGLLADGTVSSWNDAATDLFGWRESEVLGRSVPFLTDDSRPEWRTLQDRVRNGEVVTDAALRLRTVDGALVDVSAAAAPLDDADPPGMVAAFADETTRREREQRLEVLNRVLRHNVRNDLTVVLSYADHILEATDDDEVRSMAEGIRSVGEGLHDLSENARAVERVVEGWHPLQMTDVAAVVAEEAAAIRERFPDAEVRVDAPDRELAYAIDGLSTAVQNLLENAVVHTDADAPRVECRVETTREADGRWVAVTVADDGPGIPEQERAVLLEGTESDLQHGSGLGLWLVNWIVERSNGELRFDESDLGGASVTIRLRRADEAL